tara:strand:+ start:193 stop:630 length:438 start_codon:yes stop_codon:yes gene_type:complete
MSNILVQNIKHTNGTTAIEINSSAQMTVKSEGGAATTSVQQGLIKAFMDLDGQGTISLNDSFNIASVTDNNTGIYSPAVTSIYANVFYGWGGNGEHPSSTYNQRIPHCVADQQTTSSTQVMIGYAANNTAEDCEHVRIGMFGDLA